MHGLKPWMHGKHMGERKDSKMENLTLLIDKLVLSWCDHSGIGLSQHQLAEYNCKDRQRARRDAREALENALAKHYRISARRAVLDALSRERNQS